MTHRFELRETDIHATNTIVANVERRSEFFFVSLLIRSFLHFVRLFVACLNGMALPCVCEGARARTFAAQLHVSCMSVY